MYILDENPELAARYLIRTHALKYLKCIECTMLYVHRINRSWQYRKIIDKNIYYSYSNYVWFSEFYLALRKLLPDYKIQEGFHKGLLYNYPEVQTHGDGLRFLPEETPESTKKSIKLDPISHNKVCYLKKQYKKSAFLCGYPDWYLNTTSNLIFEDYFTKGRKGLRLTYEDGTYHFYTADFFNQWKEIKNVPYDIGIFIDYFLFN